MGRYKSWLCVGIFLSTFLVINSASFLCSECKNGATCDTTRSKCRCPVGYEGVYCQNDTDECKNKSMCSPHGTCINGHGSYTCTCHAGFTGSNCQIDIDDCTPSPCKNNGTCQDRPGRAVCQCKEPYMGLLCEHINQCEANKNYCNGGGDCRYNENGSATGCDCRRGYSGAFCENDIDECAQNPCSHHANCVNNHGSYRCVCRQDYTGSDCASIINYCNSSPCMNGGTCVSKTGSYKCLCKKGFYGKYCEDKVNECDSNPCPSNAQCVDIHEAYYCICPLGYTGLTCRESINRCEDDPCENGGNCTNIGNAFICSCPSGYTGHNCSVNIDDCRNISCHNNATCVDGLNMYTCSCKEGFKGILCDHDIDECRNDPCKNGGNCTNTYGDYNCACLVGFTGKNCDKNVDDCARVTCLNDGKCKDFLNNFTCDCHPGFEGKFCERNIDECASGPCRNGGTCRDGIADYKCLCTSEWSGKNCTTKNDKCKINLCKHGHCVVSGDSVVCNCKPGFTGKFCDTEINECSSSPCLHGTCKDAVNDYNCLCEGIWTGKNCDKLGYHYKEIFCFNNGVSVNKGSGAECDCPYGFYGAHCEYLQNLCKDAPCKNGATCVTGIGNYSCYCNFGYQGRHCEKKVDWCHPNPCKNNAPCIPEGNSYNCECAGTNHTGHHCHIRNWKCDIDGNRCLNGAKCEPRGAYSTCKCPPGYSGYLCEVNDDDCKAGPCKNGGTCIDGIKNYTCQCFPGFTGTNCENDINECASKPCVHGKCFDLVNEYGCKCDEGWVGTNCDENPNDCSVDACLHGGNCTDGIKTFACTCPPGFKGARCEEDVDECHSNPCNEGGTERCEDRVNDYFCRCKPGFAKRTCSFEINECLSNPCLNGGKCLDKIGRYVCECKYGWSGLNCERRVISCADNPCLNEGECNDNGGSYVCACKVGVSGMQCEYNQNDCPADACENGTTCIDGFNDWKCERCKPGYVDEKCQLSVAEKCGIVCKNNGELVANSCSCKCKEGYTGERCEKGPDSLPGDSRCPYTNCSHEFDRNADCNGKCNIEACDFAAGSCSLNRSRPWEKCPYRNCSRLFNNGGKCDSACNNANCLFDGFDCRAPVRHCRYMKKCSGSLADKRCESNCDDVGCGYGVMYCRNDTKPKLLDGILVMSLRIDVEVFQSQKGEFLLNMSVLLRTVVLINIKQDGKEDVESAFVSRRKRSILRFRREAESGSKVGLKIDNRYCKQDCFISNYQAANYLAGLKTKGVKLPGDPYKLETKDTPKPKPSTTPTENILLIAIICVTIPLIAIGVIVGGKRVFAKLWVPEGFSTRNVRQRSQRHAPIGEDSADKNSMSKTSSSEEITEDVCPGRVCPPKRMKLIDSDGPLRIANRPDNRQWTTLHKEVANVNNRTVSSLSVLTPPQEGQESTAAQNSNVNAVGPGGITPLMLAASRGSYLDEVCEDGNSDDSGSQVVGELIQYGARLELRSDEFKETALHLAARHVRADAAKRLLDAGADANARDRTGRTPLHLAVTADAQGVFQLLLRHRTTELDAQSDDGTTPLIYAARFMVHDMVDELIKAGAKVNLSDKQGKTALHWAASVDDEKATRLLLKNNAKKDAQDSKGQTPLFLASKEGSASVVKILLSSFANRKLADNMDQSPLDIAKQREHADIVALLSDWSIGCKSPTAAPAPTSPNEDMSTLACRTLSPPDVRPKLNGNPGIVGRAGASSKPCKKRQRRSRNIGEGQPPVQVAMLNGSTGNSTSAPHGLSPFSNNSYGGSLSPPNSDFSPPLRHMDNMTSPFRDSDPLHGGIPDAEFYSFAEKIYGSTHSGEENFNPEFLNFENNLDIADFELMLNSQPAQQTNTNQDCLYANQSPPGNVLPNGVNNPTCMRQKSPVAPKTWVRSPSEIAAWNSMSSNNAPLVQMNGGYHRGNRNRNSQYPTPPYELSPTSHSPEQWGSGSSPLRSSNSDCSTC